MIADCVDEEEEDDTDHLLLLQGSYRQGQVKFKDFSRTFPGPALSFQGL